MEINIRKPGLNYNTSSKTFSLSGNGIQFATSHTIINEKSGNSVKFNFEQSTGSEWDPLTEWIYKSEDDLYILRIGNDDVTQQHADNYLRAKLR